MNPRPCFLALQYRLRSLLPLVTLLFYIFRLQILISTIHIAPVSPSLHRTSAPIQLMMRSIPRLLAPTLHHHLKHQVDQWQEHVHAPSRTRLILSSLSFARFHMRVGFYRHRKHCACLGTKKTMVRRRGPRFKQP